MGSPALAGAKAEQRGKFSDRGEQIQDKGLGVGDITNCFEGKKGVTAGNKTNINHTLSQKREKDQAYIRVGMSNQNSL